MLFNRFPHFAILLITLCLNAGCNKKSPDAMAVYKNPSNPVDKRVEDLLGRMTLQEKVAQVQCLWQEKELLLDDDGNFSRAKAESVLINGLGQIGRPSENRNAREMAEFTNEIQKYFLEETRLGIPVIFHEECLHGHAAPDGTHYPQPIGLASTWDRDLIKKVFTATAKEARLRGASQALTPVVDVAREPRWGRVEETYGEDPYLVAEMGLAAVKGFQGESAPKIDKEHVIATLKHFAAHGQPESGTNIAPVNISERTLRETFFHPFKKSVADGGVMSIMASYNEIDGVPSHASDWLLNKVLRDEWGFDGVVVSDYYAIKELFSRHSVAADEASAAVLALQSGVDIELPDPECFPLLEEEIVKEGLDVAVLDQAVRRILKHKFLTGLFDDPYVDPDLAEEVVGSDEHRQLALKAAHKTITLLQNKEDVAPLDLSKVKTIAVIGPNADKELLGGYSDTPKQFITVLKGIKEKAGDVNVLYAEGCRITESGSWYEDPVEPGDPKEDLQRIREAVATARKADIVVLAIGGNELTSREAWSETHMGDRTDLQMVGMQDELVNALSETGKPIIAFLFNGRPLAVNNLVEKVPTIFECWYLGQETGYAVADILFGNVNPGGKLPITFPRSVGHIPAYYNYKPTARRGYLFEDISPLFAFGHGLSYTTFNISEPELESASIDLEGIGRVTVNVTNTGKRAGDEVVQVYIRDKVSSVTRPVKELKEFRRVTLEAGETQQVIFDITPEMLAFYNLDMDFVVETGEFEIMVGSSSRDEDLQSVTLTVTNNK